MKESPKIELDFIIQSPPLTIEEQKEISEFIKLRKKQQTAGQKGKQQRKERIS